MMNKIVNELKDLSPNELNEVHRVIQLYKKSLQHKKEEGIKLHYLGMFLGIDWDETGQIFMELGPFNENTFGVAQGGALYTLADIAIGLEVLKKVKKDEHVFTLEMKMNFIKKGAGSKLFAKTEFLHWGKTTVVAQCQIEDENKGIVAHALGTFYIAKK